jgi:hypothetical protein
VALGLEVLEDASHGVGDPVDLREEGLGDDQHPQPVGPLKRGPGELEDLGHGLHARNPRTTDPLTLAGPHVNLP